MDRMDRFERGMEHLLQMQAGHDERLTRIESLVEANAKAIDRLTERVDRLTERVDRVTENVNRLTEDVTRLTEDGKKTSNLAREVARAYLGHEQRIATLEGRT